MTNFESRPRQKRPRRIALIRFSEAYAYYPSGLRKIKTVNGVTTTYVWDGDQLVLELSGSGGVRHLRCHALLARVEFTSLTTPTTVSTVYFQHDGHGNVALKSDVSGNAIQGYKYDAFGNILNPNASDTNPFRYCGEYYDTETRTYYLRARHYRSDLGRFTQEDTARDGENWYIYCFNDPIRYIDSTGNAAEDVTRAIARAVIANPLFVNTTQRGRFKELFYAAGFVRDSSGVYHAHLDAIQQIGGYNNFYDTVFYYATSMDREKFPFFSNGRHYILWAWKGDYLNLGAGAELGIYSDRSGLFGKVNITSPSNEHWLVDTSLAMEMTLTLNDSNGNQILSYSPAEKQWWITGFNPYYQYVQANNLTATYTIKFDTMYMYNDFYNIYGTGGEKDNRWTFDQKNLAATFVF